MSLKKKVRVLFRACMCFPIFKPVWPLLVTPLGGCLLFTDSCVLGLEAHQSGKARVPPWGDAFQMDLANYHND